MHSVVIFGATGFLGKALLDMVPYGMQIKAVSRKIIPSDAFQVNNVTWHTADMSDPASIESILLQGDTVINLAYAPSQDETVNMELISNLITACKKAKVSRLLHCSTAVVVGQAEQSVINEHSICHPRSSYELTKWAIEEYLKGITKDDLDVVILRPTAVVGPGGKNLLKMANALRYGNTILNYFKTCLFGLRPMHLVPIQNVVGAIWHLVQLKTFRHGEVFIVSSDEEPLNNYVNVEAILAVALGLGKRRIKPLLLSRRIMSVLYHLLGRKEIDLWRKYDSSKLKSIGFVETDNVTGAIQAFAKALTKETERDR